MLDPLPQRVPAQLRAMAEEARARAADPLNAAELHPHAAGLWRDVLIGLSAAARDIEALQLRRLVGM